MIKARDKADTVRTVAGHSAMQWARFMKITRKAAEDLLDSEPDSTWIDITDSRQAQVLHAINTKLHEKEVPEVTGEILAWRMPRAMGEIKKPTEANARAASSPNATTPRSQYYDPARDTGNI